MADMAMHLMYVHDQKIGYGRYGVNLARELELLGVRIEDHLDPTLPSEQWAGSQGLKDGKPTAAVACWVSVPAHVFGCYEGQIPYVSTMWEATRLPESFREGIENFKKIIVPSDQNVELFSRYHKDVVKVPLGIDPVKWHYVPRQPPDRYFTYLIGGSGVRKGNDLALRAFRRLWGQPGSWGDGPMPKIIFKAPKPGDEFGERVERVSGWVPEERERSLYEAAHCYLQPSRGEGFGLQPLQAIAQGIPTILTNAHGHADFAHLGYGLSTTMSTAEYFIHGDAGEWWEPDFDELCEYMEYVYYNFEEACRFAEMASEVARTQWTWENCAKQFIEAIGVEELCTSYTGNGNWKDMERRLFPVRTLKFWPCSIAGHDYQFLPGETYYTPADVKRILFEQGVLNPNCIVASSGEVTEDEIGLAPQQLLKVPQYSIERMHCQMCGHKLNEGEKWDPQFDDEGNLVG